MVLLLIPQALLLAHALVSPVAVTPGEQTVAAVAGELPKQEVEQSTLTVMSPPGEGDVAPAGAETTQPGSAIGHDAPDAGIVVSARTRIRADPFQHMNVKSFNVTQKVDDSITAPLAHAYEQAMPTPLRIGVSNFLDNLHEPVVFVNFVLQHKIGKAAETFARFAIDTTAGAGGIIDIAKSRPFNLPRRPNGFADTLGFYGVNPGAYLFLPLMGPTTVRDLAGGLLDRLMLVAVPGTPLRGATWTVPTGVLHTLDKRIQLDDKLEQQRATNDPYSTRRDYYLLQRQAEIAALHGKGYL